MAWEEVVNPNLTKFLDFLGKAEGADWNTVVGGSTFDDYSKHPGIVGLRSKEGPSTAAGRYQITQTTYNDVAPRLGITDFSPESQNRIAVELMKRKGAYDDVIAGNFDSAIGKLGSTWASLPSSPYSQPKRDAKFVKANLTDGWEDVKPAQAAPNDGWEDVGTTKATKPAVEPSKAPAEAADFAKLGKTLHKAYKGSEFKGTDAEAAEWAQQFASDFRWNTASMGNIAVKSADWDPESKQAFLDLQNAYDKVPTASLDTAKRIGESILTDPVTYLTLGAGKAIAKGGQTATAAAVRNALEKSLAKRIVTSNAGKAAAEGAVFAGTQNALQQATQVNTGGQEEFSGADLGKSVALGGGLGAGVGKLVDKVTGITGVKNLARQAGSEEALKIDAEAITRIKSIADNPNFRGQPVRAEQLNSVANGFVKEADDAIKAVGAKEIAARGGDAKLFRGALQQWKRATEPEIQALRGTEVGDAVADSITKAQRLRSLTAEQEAAGGLAKVARGVTASAPIPLPLHFALKGALGTAKSRKQATDALIRPSVAQRMWSGSPIKAAERVLRDLGPSQASKASQTLADLAASAVTTQGARASAPRAARKASPAINKIIDKAQSEFNAGVDDARALQQGMAEEKIDLAGLATRTHPDKIDQTGIVKLLGKTQDNTNETVLDNLAAQQPNLSNLGSLANRVDPPVPNRLDETGIARMLGKAQGVTNDEVLQALAAQQPELSKLGALAERVTPPAANRIDDTPLIRAMGKAQDKTNEEVLQALAIQQPDVSKLGALADPKTDKDIGGGILKTLTEVAEENKAMGLMDGKTAVGNEVKNIKQDGKGRKKAQAAAQKAEAAAKQVQEVAETQAAQKAQLEEILNGGMPRDLDPQAGPFQGFLKYIDADADTQIAALREIVKENPEYGKSLIQLFTPGGKVTKIKVPGAPSRSPYYELQNQLTDAKGKYKFGKKEPKPEPGILSTGEGILSQPQGKLDGEGQPIISQYLYEASKYARQGQYDSAIKSVGSLEISKAAKAAAKEAITDLKTGSPSNAEAVLNKVDKRLSKLTPEEKASVEAVIEPLITRFYSE